MRAYEDWASHLQALCNSTSIQGCIMRLIWLNHGCFGWFVLLANVGDSKILKGWAAYPSYLMLEYNFIAGLITETCFVFFWGGGNSDFVWIGICHWKIKSRHPCITLFLEIVTHSCVNHLNFWTNFPLI